MTQPAFEPPVPDVIDPKNDDIDQEVDEEPANPNVGGESFDYDFPEPPS